MNEQSPIFGISQRLPPANVLAEQSLLGAIIRNNRAFENVAGFLRAEHFSDPVHGNIYTEMGRLIGAGRLADAVTLNSIMANTGALDEVGGTPYFSVLMSAMVGIINAVDYAKVIVDAAVRRRLIDIGERLVNSAFGTDPSLNAEAIASATLAEIEGASALSPDHRFITLDEAMDSALAAMRRAASGDAPGGISTGFRCVDQRLGGLEPGLVYVVAGRPGMGKSSWGHEVAVNAARNGVGVLELSLEMSAQQLGRRTLATAAGVPIMAIKAGSAERDLLAADRIVAARQELAGLPLAIDDAGGQTAAQIAAKARAYRRKHGLGLIMIDHLNLMRADDADARHGGTWAVERASATTLQLAKECECPVLLLAQLNRGVEGREDKRPGLSDLRQAGAIEQDAYAVGFVYRPEYYLGGEPEPKTGDTPARAEQKRQEWLDQKATLAGRAELIWAKVRDGEPGTDRLTFHGPTATFGELIDDR